MRFKHRALSLLLALAMVLTFMPALAFADGDQKPVGLEFQGGDFIYTPGFGNEDSEESVNSNVFENLFADGSKIIIKYKDHNEVFEARHYHYTGDDEDNLVDYFPEGEEPEVYKDEDGYWSVANAVGFEYSINKAGLVTITYEFGEGETISTTKQAKEYNKPVSVSYKGPALVYEPGDEEKRADIYNEGAEITVTYKDGTTRTADCRVYASYKEEGYEYHSSDYFWKGEEPEVYKDEEGYYCTKNGLNDRGVLYCDESVVNNELQYTYEESFNDAYFKVSEKLPVTERKANWALDVAATRYVRDINVGVYVYDKDSKYGEDYADITKVTSSKKSVLAVKKSTYKDENGKRQINFWLEAKKPGKATITVKYKAPSGKTGTLKKTITVKKNPNQIKSIKVNGKAVKLSYNEYFFDAKTKKTSVKVKMALKKGWKIKSVEAYAYNKNDEMKELSVSKTAISKGKSISFPKKYKELRVRINMSKGKDVVPYEICFHR